MAEATADQGAEGTEEPKRAKGMPGKKLVLFIALPLLLLLGGAGGAYVAGVFDPPPPPEDMMAEGEKGSGSGGGTGMNSSQMEEGMMVDKGPAYFYDLPEMLVNLHTSGKRANYLKITISLELASENDKSELETLLPRVIDNMQVYLRELRVEDLRGSAGIQRLREELLLRVKRAAYPAGVRDVLFKEMLVQ